MNDSLIIGAKIVSVCFLELLFFFFLGCVLMGRAVYNYFNAFFFLFGGISIRINE